MDANVKRTLGAALRAAQSAVKADDKLATSTEAFIKAAGGFDAAVKLLNMQREAGRTWKDERAENTPIWRVYNAVSVMKSRAKPKAERKPRQAAGKGQQQGQQQQQDQQQQGQQAAAAKPATPADIMGVVLSWTPAQIAQAVNDQTAVLTASAIDTLTEVLGLLINQAPPAPPARKRAPRKTAK